MSTVIIASCRNPALTREQFLHHLHTVHWGLIHSHPTVLSALPGYVQNHASVNKDVGALRAPFRKGLERDAVIELSFPTDSGFEQLKALPEYIDHIRPDEAYMATGRAM